MELLTAVLYNTDFEHITGAASPDAVSVRVAAEAVRDALRVAGHAAELVGAWGKDLPEVTAALARDRPDLVFNLVESLGGVARNEVVVPALLDLMGLAYTGGDAIALGLSLYKPRTKDVLIGRGVATPPYRVVASADDLARVAAEALDYPWFVKLANEDASVGITEANVLADGAALAARCQALLKEFGEPLLLERYVAGREVNVTLLGSGADVVVLPLHEIDFAAMPAGRPHIVSYAAKWDEQHVDYAGTKPVPLRDATPALTARIVATARAAWDAIGLRDYGRVDLRIDPAGVPWVIDVNPNCDISPDAGVHRAAMAHGWTYPQLISGIAELAHRRARGRAS
ncbi:MAG: D-alanine--D-alanine ligase [Myxococcales bacterium]|nr:D-alanine--D-alanine ligase [Myxococcales bacterium]